MKIYVSGPISDYKYGNKPAFDAMANKLRSMGHEVVNPWDLDLVERVKTWEDNLRRDIRYLMYCDAIVLLEGWENSKGAQLEVDVAYHLDMKMYYVKNGALVNLPIVIDREITPLFPSEVFEKV